MNYLEKIRQRLETEGIANMCIEFYSPQPTFDETHNPSQIFLSMRTSCKFFSGKWEDNDKTCEPILVFCNHPENGSDVEGNCNVNRCPLLKGKIK